MVFRACSVFNQAFFRLRDRPTSLSISIRSHSGVRLAEEQPEFFFEVDLPCASADDTAVQIASDQIIRGISRRSALVLLHRREASARHLVGGTSSADDQHVRPPTPIAEITRFVLLPRVLALVTLLSPPLKIELADFLLTGFLAAGDVDRSFVDA